MPVQLPAPVQVVAAPPAPVQVVAAPPAPVQAPAPASETVPPVAAPHKTVARPKLTIRIRPYATVFLDGVALGQTPLAPVPVSLGEHTVRLINRDLGKDISRSITVKAGQPAIFTFDLELN